MLDVRLSISCLNDTEPLKLILPEVEFTTCPLSLPSFLALERFVEVSGVPIHQAV